jgi:hypothetical protein
MTKLIKILKHLWKEYTITRYWMNRPRALQAKVDKLFKGKIKGAPRKPPQRF